MVADHHREWMLRDLVFGNLGSKMFELYLIHHNMDVVLISDYKENGRGEYLSALRPALVTIL